jgi:CTP synthase
VSIIEALTHASAWLGVKPQLEWIESTDIEVDSSILSRLEGVDGAIILPGFGKRGAEGKIAAIKKLRESSKPVLGICFGMQLMAVEIARNIAGLEGANSQELDPETKHPVVALAPSQDLKRGYGGTLILGSRRILIEPGTLAWRIYGTREVYERHRHRYTINSKYISLLESAGLKVSGYSEEGYSEIIELKDRVFFFGVQFHPEFNSKPLNPSKVYLGFLNALL